MNKHILSLLVLLMALAFYIHTGIAYLFLHQPWQFTAWVSTWMLILSVWIQNVENREDV